MATSKQEQTYNEIVEYYSYSDRLMSVIEDSTHNLSERQFAIVVDITHSLEECADKLTTRYIDFVKSGDSKKEIDAVRSSLNEIVTKIEGCHNKILMLYQENELIEDEVVEDEIIDNIT